MQRKARQTVLGSDRLAYLELAKHWLDLAAAAAELEATVTAPPPATDRQAR